MIGPLEPWHPPQCHQSGKLPQLAVDFWKGLKEQLSCFTAFCFTSCFMYQQLSAAQALSWKYLSSPAYTGGAC